MTEREAYIALNMIPSIGALTVRAGVEYFGSAVGFVSASEGELRNVRGIGASKAAALAASVKSIDWRAEEIRAESHSLKLVTLADDAYPARLRAIHSPPLVLYVAGSVGALSLPSVAIVGTRAPTPYGAENARSFSYRLAQSGLCIVSGLARGIDTEAANGALLASGKTVAVIGSALDRLYPPENRELARRIVESGGAVVSEYPFGRVADKQTFPMRNRIISGLSQGVLCVEAGISSGTLITVDHALEQGRAVMAIPGRISDPSALGCHKIIKSGARLVESPADVLDELSALPGLSTPPQVRETTARSKETEIKPAQLHVALSSEEQALASALSKGEASPDQLVARSGLAPHRVGTLLIGLEMKGIVARSPANLYKLRKSL